MIRANRFARIALRIARATKFTEFYAIRPLFLWHIVEARFMQIWGSSEDVAERKLPEFDNFRPEFCSEFRSEVAPSFSRSFRT